MFLGLAFLEEGSTENSQSPVKIEEMESGADNKYQTGRAEASERMRTRGSKRPRTHLSLKESDMAKQVTESEPEHKKINTQSPIAADQSPSKAQLPAERVTTRRKSARLSRAPRKFDDSEVFFDKEETDASSLKGDGEAGEEKKRRRSSRLQRDVDEKEEDSKGDPAWMPQEEGSEDMDSSHSPLSDRGGKGVPSPQLSGSPSASAAAISPSAFPSLTISTRASARERRPKRVWSPDDGLQQHEGFPSRQRQSTAGMSVVKESDEEKEEEEESLFQQEKELADVNHESQQPVSKKVKLSSPKEPKIEPDIPDMKWTYTVRRGKYDLDKVVTLVQQMQKRLLDESELQVLDTVSRSGNIGHIQTIRDTLAKQKEILTELCSQG
mmetsp:Transcript_14464/g.18983  ORF Transcript_14464/g.18983 Transcript_14464/m.18983 type:complete len:382 (-) Transcript_14464:167-1312(-)